MQAIHIIQEIQLLPLDKKFWIVEETLKAIKKEETNRLMELAVSELYADYATDKELTAFTELDLKTIKSTI